jgi:hypothetical protein
MTRTERETWRKFPWLIGMLVFCRDNRIARERLHGATPGKRTRVVKRWLKRRARG